jgi:N-acetylneuraminate synthase
MANTVIKFGPRKVGDAQPVYMIAEIGINHNGSIDVAKRLLDATFASFWDCAKFQKRDPDTCVPEEQKGVMRQTPWGEMTYLEYKKRVEFSFKEYSVINEYCAKKPLVWTASAWDVKSLDFLLKFNVPFVKIASACLTDHDLIIEAARSKVPVVLSTGMSEIEEIDKAVELLEENGDGDYILMHTNSAYPTPLKDLNLKMIKTLKERYNCIVGYSGHEYNLEPTVTAVMVGAKLVERHITLDHTMWGSDHSASIEVPAMGLLQKRIKDLDLMLGDGVKRITNEELAVRKKLRKKLLKQSTS